MRAFEDAKSKNRSAACVRQSAEASARRIKNRFIKTKRGECITTRLGVEKEELFLVDHFADRLARGDEREDVFGVGSDHVEDVWLIGIEHALHGVAEVFF